MSDDGTRVVGVGGGFINPDRAIVWTAEIGIRDLRSALLALGAEGMGEVELTWAADISLDGRVIVGNHRWMRAPGGQCCRM